MNARGDRGTALAVLFDRSQRQPRGRRGLGRKLRGAVEPICHKDTLEIEKALKGVKTLIRHNGPKPASVALARAAGALRNGYARLKIVPPPPAEEAELAKWLGF